MHGLDDPHGSARHPYGAPPPRGAAPAPSPLGPLLALLVIVLLAAFLWKVAVGLLGGGSLHDGDAAPRAVTPRGDLAADEQATIELFDRCSPSVVHITTLELVARRDRFRMNAMWIPQGSGSGFVWDATGYVVTNFHVIRGAERAIVILQDRSEYEARLVGYAPNFDVAVLRIDAPSSKLRPIALGQSDDLRVGQKVFAIGNPFGLDQTLTTGVISGLEREILSVAGTPIAGVVQTDAAINPGNSGGPLLDSAGRLIGINTAIKSPTGASAGIGFAVPVNAVNEIVPQLIQQGRVVEEPRRARAALGVRIASDSVARSLGLEGVIVTEVLPGSGAEAAGLRPPELLTSEEFRGDLIVGVDGKHVRTTRDLFMALDALEPGQTVEVAIERVGRPLVLDVTLQALQ